MDLQRGAASLEGTSPTLSDLERLCGQLHLEVHTAALPQGFLGAFDHERQRILLARGLTPVEQRSVLAHELGHALLMHVGSSSADERAAERFAARVLIDPGALAAACRWARDDVELADELGVTVDIVQSYRDQLGSRRAA
ncbi:ImmA/IrrE family metallo-endopeptidase [Agrococcus sp. Marseille-Q4369]|uniref:ImmA/IrrE family metallo-endopeptidase n=1 Tax=Agrococcus sp. Marseille-Q4369 TaxID=2810513 RepID=UPI001B8C5C7D|nr:ImmA/IrrE family metallo-endopeptidase [Agrococcus sp. Marseille-Q4369]QUW17638.1 ImmA/IrrE family metallo-endopeptidase [Agrococcus sp. Marseille-Q4369]